MTGNRYGKLVVQSFAGIRYDKHMVWEVLCDCSATRLVTTNMLLRGDSRSCGCYQKTQASEWSAAFKTTHGMTGTKELELLYSAKHRSKKAGIPFSLKVTDIVIPKKCPVLGIEIWTAPGIKTDHSPSLDRIDNTKGYIPSNVWVISWRANALKRDGTLEELEMLVKALRKKLKESA